MKGTKKAMALLLITAMVFQLGTFTVSADELPDSGTAVSNEFTLDFNITPSEFEVGDKVDAEVELYITGPELEPCDLTLEIPLDGVDPSLIDYEYPLSYDNNSESLYYDITDYPVDGYSSFSFSFVPPAEDGVTEDDEVFSYTAILYDNDTGAKIASDIASCTAIVSTGQDNNGTDSSDGNETELNYEGFSSSTYGITLFNMVSFNNVVSNLSIKVTVDDVEIGINTLISFDDTLIVRYDFNISEEMVEYIHGLYEDDDSSAMYLLTLPDYLDFTSLNTTEPYPIYLNNHTQYAELIIDEYGDVYIKFTGEFWQNYTAGEINDAFFELECKLDKTEVDNTETITLTFDGNKSVEIQVSENVPTPYTVTKEGTYDNEALDTGYISWAITIEPGTVEITLPITIIDTFDNNTQNEFDGSSVILKLGNAELVKGTNYSVEVDDTNETTTVTYVISSLTIGDVTYSAEQKLKLTDNIVLTYNTKFTEEAYYLNSSSGSLSTTVNNTVNVTDSDSSGINVSAEDTVTANQQMVLKEGKVISSTADNYIIQWTLRVSTGNVTNALTYLKLYDAIPDGLTLVNDSVYIGSSSTAFDNNNTPTTDDNDYPDANIYTYTFSSPYATTYTITYYTKVDSRYFTDDLKSYELENKAWLEYKFTGTDEGESIIIPPSVDKAGFSTKIIQKSAKTTNNSYYYELTSIASKKAIQWEIILNPNYLNIKSGAVITDELPEGLEYVDYQDYEAVIEYYNSSGNDVTSTYEDAIDVSYSIDTRTLEFKTTEDLSGIRVVITFYTYVDETKFTINNTSTTSPVTFTNPADFEGSVKLSSDDNYTVIKDSDNGTIGIRSSVLSKSGTFNSTNNTITWRISVNKNGITMTGATLTDKLPEALAYVKDSFKVYKGSTTTIYPASEGIPNCVPGEVTDGKYTLTMSLGNLSEWVTVEFKTTVDVDNYKIGESYPFRESGSFVISNTVELLFNEINIPVSYTDKTLTITNNFLNKTGTAKDGIATYKVYINPHGLELEGMMLLDNIPADLVLDYNSIKLYAVPTYSSSGTTLPTYTDSNLVNTSDWNWTYEPDRNNLLTITLPGSSSYVLVYECYVMADSLASVNNTITFSGDYVTGAIATATKSSLKVKSGGTFVEKLKTHLDIIKVDRVHGDIPIAGATFDLYTVFDGEKQIVDTKETDTAGKIVFTGLIPNWLYWVEEADYAIGYEADSEILINSSLIKSVRNDDTGAISFTAYNGSAILTYSNDPSTFDIAFSKLDQFERDVTGVEFELVGITGEDGIATDYNDTAVSTDGVVSFSDVPWGTYTLCEISSPAWYRDDDTEYTVVIDKNGDYTITNNTTEEQVYDSVDADSDWSVINIYVASGSLSLVGTKRMLGRSLNAREFTFVLEDDLTGDTFTALNEKSGYIYFNALTYTAADKGKTFTYTVYEAPGNLRRVTYDRTIYKVTVEVIDKGNGVLTTDVSYAYANGNTADGLTFINRYRTSGGNGNNQTDPDPDPTPSPSKPSTEEEDESEPSTPVTPPPTNTGNPSWPPSPDEYPETLIPRYPGDTIRPDPDREGVYIEIGDNDTPLGEWTQDDDGVWIFDEYPPLGDAPDTGDSSPIVPLILLVILCGILIPILVLKKRGVVLISRKK